MDIDAMAKACGQIRGDIEDLKQYMAARVSDLNSMRGQEDPILEVPSVPPTVRANMAANFTLVYRALEEARMRLGKVLQASQGGVSILDKQPTD